jgi:hypothetical protein
MIKNSMFGIFAVFLYAFLIFFLIHKHNLALADEVPFNQCIHVVDVDGSSLTSLNCTYEDSFGTQNMTLSGSLYCVEITSAYDYDIEYSFTAVCTDGTINKSVQGTFTPQEAGVIGSAPPSPPPPSASIPEDNVLTSTGILDFFKSNPWAFIPVFIFVAFGTFWSTKKYKKHKSKRGAFK